ncbi:MAG TPA: D-sedoheptulose 7-phosphate isomerase [Bacteroidales bacterium]|nr:D-sedoheptulose 7-phosphate isomerase [Bacteroidales bacterium]HOU97517.1 D-sedoheptulose 7-phosphate isomerase [Bacteroidales bacterium]
MDKNNHSVIAQRIQDSISIKSLLLENKETISTINSVANILIQAFKQNKNVWFCGNGGSAADAQHIAAELSGRYLFDRPPLPAEALHVNSSYLTAVANDYGFDEVYARLIDAMGKKGDVLVGISTSGNSKNVINAFEKAKGKGLTIVAMTGNKISKMAELSHYCIRVPSTETPRIQEAHIMIGHILCEIIEDVLFKK